MHRHFHVSSRARQAGFTLIEMLVTIGILVLVMAMVLTGVHVATSDKNIPGASGQIKSQLQGAQSRATYFGRRIGVRFLLDPTIPEAVTSTIYIGDSEPYTDGTVQVASDQRTVTGTGTRWQNLLRRELIVPGHTMIFLDDQYFTFTMGAGETLLLTKDYIPPPAAPFPYTVAEHRMLLEPSVLPNQEPITLPRGTVLDLNSSIVPYEWGAPGAYADKLDILFSPRGPAEIHGNCRLVFSTIEDVTLGRGVEIVDRSADSRIISILPSGRMYASPVDYTDANGNGRADDPFNFAETGESSTF